MIEERTCSKCKVGQLLSVDRGGLLIVSYCSNCGEEYIMTKERAEQLSLFKKR